MKKFIITFIILFSLDLNAQIIYPEYTEDKVIDLSNKFDSRYLNKLENELNSSENDIKIVFIKSENKINLGIYSAKLFDKWKMSDDSILVVIDPFTNKRGFAIGKNIKENLKNRKKVENNKKENDITENDIDYNNLVDVINNKFSPDSLVTSSNKKNKNTFSQKESVNTGSSSSSSNINSDRKSDIDYSKLLKYSILGIIIGAFSYLVFFLYKKREKKNKDIENKNNLSFEANMKLQEISDLIETLNQDLESFIIYKKRTKEYLEEDLNKLRKFISNLEKFYENLSLELENISDDNLDEIYKIIDDFNLLQIDINNTHLLVKEKRKEIKKIIKNSSENISNIRVYLENNIRLIDENSKIYNLELSFMKILVEKISNEIFNIDINEIKNDPIFFKEKISELEYSLIQMKKDLDTIPHLYLQINNQITDIINKKNLSNDKEVNLLKQNALKSLNDGDMKKSSELIEKIFKILNK